MTYSEREQWFQDRIGKVVYRNKTTCTCKICDAVYERGVHISDRQHATYLHDVESELTGEGHDMTYFDTIEERDEFEKQINIK